MMTKQKREEDEEEQEEEEKAEKNKDKKREKKDRSDMCDQSMHLCNILICFVAQRRLRPISRTATTRSGFVPFAAFSLLLVCFEAHVFTIFVFFLLLLSSFSSSFFFFVLLLLL